MIELTLPYPISANRYWRSFVPRSHQRAIVTLSDEAKAYKQDVGWKVRQAGVRQPISGRVCVEVDLYPQRPLDWAKRQRKLGDAWHDGVMCIDLDNANKVLLDALKGFAFDDDKWVHELRSRRMEPDAEGARVVIRITPLASAPAPQMDLLGETV